MIEDITNVNLDTPELQDHLITGACVGIDIKRSSSCIFCNKTLEQSQLSGTTIKCPNCRITILISAVKTKLVCQLLMQVDNKILSYTAINDAMQSFCRNMGYDKMVADIEEEELTLALLNAGSKRHLVDNSAKIISQFLPQD